MTPFHGPFSWPYSAAEAGKLVLMDRDDDGSSYGDYGQPGSGLDLRVWAMQGPDGSVWRTREQGGGSLAYEQYLYTPEGKAWDPYDLGDPTGIEVYDGLVYFPGSGEHDTLAGNPLAEDVYAYVQAQQLYSNRSSENTQLPGNGTTDAFAHPVGSGG